MERPKVTPKLIKRPLTGEVVYLGEMRQLEQFPKPYSDLSDMAIQMYEESAALLVAHNVRPDIMDEYEQYDTRFDELYLSCAALAEECLALKDPSDGTTFIDIVVKPSAEEVLAKLQAVGLDRSFTKNDEQLAVNSKDDRYPVMDIKKCDATLTGVGLTVFGWSDRTKYIILSDRKRSPLVYPSDEQSKWYQIELSFSYNHPEHGYFNEKMTLSIGTQGDLGLSTSVFVGEYAEQGYEGHGGGYLKDQTDEDVTRFADIIAEIVGDTPMSVRQWYDQYAEQYIARVVKPESAEYLREWVANSWSAQVLGDLQRTRCGETMLISALISPEQAEEAHAQLVELVEGERARRNEAAQDTSMAEYFGIPEPWQDSVVR